MKISIKFTVFFEGVFWVGVFERVSGEKYEVSKVIFGIEPKDYEVYDFVLKNFYSLKFSNSLSIAESKNKKINPKRLQREIKKETENSGVGTKAQLAIKLQYEANKEERRKNSKKKNEQEKERQFELRQRKKKEKHNGH
ncbi:YjdF family protein [Clostridium pasteurianum]|uniref:DUF2992 family protein n=1 Tax=Clostridium pasteurianum BC1 TaxID=86416 RepID=R4K8T7_CLOPA|nr:YjdF family protein [Clostridium pasteurianum]AGK96959.1 Protein of unknown function (DUF2992) [Clostridium pasteurianum BC1]